MRVRSTRRLTRVAPLIAAGLAITVLGACSSGGDSGTEAADTAAEEAPAEEAPAEEAPEEPAPEASLDLTQIAGIAARVGKDLSRSQARVLLRVAGLPEADVEALLEIEEEPQLPFASLEMQDVPENEGLHLHSVAFSRNKFPTLEQATRAAGALGVDGDLSEGENLWAARPEGREDDEFLPHTVRISKLADGVFITRARLKADYYPDGRTYSLPSWRRSLSDAYKASVVPHEAKAYKSLRGYFNKQRNASIKSLSVPANPNVKAERSNPEDYILTQEDIDNALAAIDVEAITGAIGASAVAAYAGAYNSSLGQIAGLGILTPDGFVLQSSRLPLLSDSFYAQRIPGWLQISTSVKQAVRDNLLQVYQKGGNLQDGMSAVSDAFKGAASTARTRVIARTEIGISSSEGKWGAFASGGVERVEWLSAGDGNVRDSHQIDGEVRPMGTAFSNGLTTPLDPNAYPGEIINCRCTIVPVVD